MLTRGIEHGAGLWNAASAGWGADALSAGRGSFSWALDRQEHEAGAVEGGDPAAAVEASGAERWNTVSVGRSADALSAAQDSFDRVLGRRPREIEGPDAARRAAEDFVSMALVLPVLKQLRETNMAAPPFAPGEAEKKFGALLDAEYASRLVRSTRFPVVDAVAERMGWSRSDGEWAADEENGGMGWESRLGRAGAGGDSRGEGT